MFNWLISYVDKYLFCYPLYYDTPLKGYRQFLFTVLTFLTYLLSGNHLIKRALNDHPEYTDPEKKRLLPEYIHCLDAHLLNEKLPEYEKLKNNQETVEKTVIELTSVLNVQNETSKQLLLNSISTIHEFDLMIANLVKTAGTPFQSTNAEHEEKLLQVTSDL
jgi:hypothetical protein